MTGSITYGVSAYSRSESATTRTTAAPTTGGMDITVQFEDVSYAYPGGLNVEEISERL